MFYNNFENRNNIIKEIGGRNMTEQKEFNNELNEIRKELLLELKHWWGLRYPGYTGTIITNKHKAYIYEFSKELSGDTKKYIKLKKELTDEEFEKVCTFVKNEVMPIEVTYRRLYDAGYDVVANYDGVKKVLSNYKGTKENPLIYDRTEAFLKELLDV